METAVADAFDVNWCFSSNDFAFCSASFPKTKPFASIVLTTSSACCATSDFPSVSVCFRVKSINEIIIHPTVII
ncbi:hypothetical protein Hanom_Chr16g01506991 [Helianthus anomalus]